MQKVYKIQTRKKLKPEKKKFATNLNLLITRKKRNVLLFTYCILIHGFIPGIRPGKKTSEYIDKVLTRITLGGAIYVSAVCVLPTFLMDKFNVPFYFGGTALLIVVGVVLDTMKQLEAQLLMRHYEGFIK